MASIQEQIKKIVASNKVVIFMKGTPQAPQCGFSARSIQCLQSVKAPIVSVDVLSEPDMRDGVKEFTQWPTIPQIFINGEFIGGCDIITEMYQNGELKDAVK